tara:strand:+ start:269 stop:529 length:261 start_codon:yes stop_codon:yes gene_type:complete
VYPFTAIEVNDPTDVIAGCAAVPSVPFKVVALTVVPFKVVELTVVGFITVALTVVAFIVVDAKVVTVPALTVAPSHVETIGDHWLP